MNKKVLEAIAVSVEDIKAINKTNADRIELVSRMEHGGMTPSLELWEAASELSTKDVVVMLREHYGTWAITEKQVDELVEIIKKTKHLNFEGYVYGAVENGKVDEVALKRISEAAAPKKIIFHRCFDSCDNIEKAAATLKKYDNVVRVLTAGGTKNKPLEDLESLKRIKATGLDVLVGGGVVQDIVPVLAKEGFTSIHVGSALRADRSYDKSIKPENVNDFKSALLETTNQLNK